MTWTGVWYGTWEIGYGDEVIDPGGTSFRLYVRLEPALMSAIHSGLMRGMI